jgi:hypothetical protein
MSQHAGGQADFLHKVPPTGQSTIRLPHPRKIYRKNIFTSLKEGKRKKEEERMPF